MCQGHYALRQGGGEGWGGVLGEKGPRYATTYIGIHVQTLNGNVVAHPDYGILSKRGPGNKFGDTIWDVCIL